MRALVVYESMFGNTRDVAQAVARGLGPYGSVTTEDAANAPLALRARFDLVVVGGPTHAFGMSWPRTRADAATRRDAAMVTGTEVGIREWLVALRPNPEARMCAAVFDTRVDLPRVPGSAARHAYRAMARHGFAMLVPPESFHVHGTDGPLVAGELARAEAWGAQLGRAMARHAASRPRAASR
jgi:hypothetical protein